VLVPLVGPRPDQFTLEASSEYDKTECTRRCWHNSDIDEGRTNPNTFEDATNYVSWVVMNL
jgi:hypothetical protein